MLSQIAIIITKEFRQKARGLSTIGVLTFVLAVIALVSYFVLLSGYVSYSGGWASASAIGRSLAVGVLISQLILTSVFGLSFNGSAITQERDRETIDLLNLTLLSSSGIVFGKMLSSMLYIILVLFAGLPFFALSYTFGGWELSELASAIAVEFSLVFLVSCFGLLISVTSKDTRVALGRTFALLIFGAAGTLYFGIKLLGSLSFSGALDWFHTSLGYVSILVNPAFALMSILFADDMSMSQVVGSAWLSSALPFWAIAVLVQLLLSLLALLVAVRIYKKIRQGAR